jgi:hypothetical protein
VHRAAAVCRMLLIGLVLAGAIPVGIAHAEASLHVERVTTKVYFPRGLVLKDGELYVLSRGRVREYGGASSAITDQAGTIYAVDPSIAQPIGEPVSEAVANNARVVAAPTSPPFKLLDTSLPSVLDDHNTDRPYCTLRFDEATQSFYLCAFSGLDRSGQPSFRKNLTDAVLRYDLRTQRWYEIDRHDPSAGAAYPHHDPAANPPPHGWLKGPDNCLVVGHWLYAVAKDNNVLARYDLRGIAANPDAPPPGGEIVLGERVMIEGAGEQTHLGHSMLAQRDGWLYVGYRTSSTIVRYPMNADGTLVTPIVGQLVARFEPWDPESGRSANLTDMDFDAQGRLYVISAQPARVYRFTPDPKKIYDATQPGAMPWADMASLTDNPQMKGENVLVDPQGRVYVTSGDAYGHTPGYGGAVYRVSEQQN